MVVLLYVGLSACESDRQSSLGATAWTVALDRDMQYGGDGVVGASGHAAMFAETQVALFAPEGEGLLWYQPLERGYGTTSVAVDADGNTFVLNGVALGRAELFAIATDGRERWRHRFTWGGGTGELLSLLVDGAGSLWVLGSGTGGFDFGGGVVRGPGDEAVGVWARFDAEGQHLASGALDLAIDLPVVALPDRDGVVVNALRAGRHQLLAIDGAGAEVYSIYASSPWRLCAHEGGELTVAVGGQLVHLDAEHRERWRADVHTTELTPLRSGGLVGIGSDGGEAFIQLVGADGAMSELETFSTATITLASGPPSDRYYFLIRSSPELDLHDQPIDRGGWYMVARDVAP